MSRQVWKHKMRKSTMDRQRWLAVSPYLDQALELPKEQLDEWLRRVSLTDPLVAADVRRLVLQQFTGAFASFLTGLAAGPSERVRNPGPGESQPVSTASEPAAPTLRRRLWN